jgi:hypothetical protein
MEGKLEPFVLGGATDYPDDDVVVEVFEGRGATMVPRTLQKIPAEAKLEIAGVIRRVAGINKLHEELDELVESLRSRGVSWHGIGWALGTTGEAARQRFGE